MILADFNPAILFLLLWGLLSWFTKKKKKEARKNLTEDSGVKIEKEDIFTRLQKLQDHLAGEVDILPKKPEEEFEWEEDEIEKESDFVQEPVIEYPVVEEVVWDGSTPLVTKPAQVQTTKGNWLSTIMTDKNNIKKAIILNEILGEPRGMRPY